MSGCRVLRGSSGGCLVRGVICGYTPAKSLKHNLHIIPTDLNLEIQSLREKSKKGVGLRSAAHEDR